MVKLMNLDELLEIARGAGIHLEKLTSGVREETDRENLYVYATNDADQDCVYVGKSADRSRAVTEKSVIGQGYKERVGVGFSALIAENNAKRHSFFYDPDSFTPDALIAHIEKFGWDGPAIKNLREKLQPGARLTHELVEQILVRIHVCTGRLIGNSQFASQWEHNVSELPNVIALLAADIARESGKALLSEEILAAEMVAEGAVKHANVTA